MGTFKLLNACLLESSVTHRRVAHEPFWISCFCVLCKQAILPYLPKSPATHVTVAGLLHGAIRRGHYPRISNRLRRAVILDGAGGALVETLLNMRAGTIFGMREGHMTLPRTLKVTRQRDGTKIEVTPVQKMTVEMRKVSAPVPANVTDVETTHKKLLELQHLLNNRKGSLSSTCKKNTEHQDLRSQPEDHAGPGHFRQGI